MRNDQLILEFGKFHFIMVINEWNSFFFFFVILFSSHQISIYLSYLVFKFFFFFFRYLMWVNALKWLFVWISFCFFFFYVFRGFLLWFLIGYCNGQFLIILFIAFHIVWITVRYDAPHTVDCHGWILLLLPLDLCRCDATLSIFYHED